MYRVSHIINGKPLDSSVRDLPIFNPALGKQIATVAVANQEIVDQAVNAAKDSFISWSQVTPTARAKIFFRFKSLIEKSKIDLAEIVTREHGKTRDEALGSIQRGLDVVDFVCGIASHLRGSYSQKVGTGVDSYSLHQPLGVCVGITPFNFPAMIPLWMFPMAVACGNTFILKPSEKVPSCAKRLIELVQEAGLPDGVVNLVNGDVETVNALITHQDVKAVSFVGSSVVAEKIQQTAIAHHKRVQAFGGAKNHCLIMPDADLEQVAQALSVAAYDCAGERCMAISVAVIVGDDTADSLIQKIIPKISNISVGQGNDDNVTMGPLVTESHLKRVQEYIQIGKDEGAKLVIDGSQQKPDLYPNGFFMYPCLFDHVTSNMRIYQEEIFGPVLLIMRVASFEEGLNYINQHQYGNGTAIFTRDGYYAHAFAMNVQAGMVGVNVPVPVPVASHSFGGWKRSIFSDIGMYGQEGIRFYTKLKTITERWQQAGENAWKL